MNISFNQTLTPRAVEFRTRWGRLECCSLIWSADLQIPNRFMSHFLTQKGEDVVLFAFPGKGCLQSVPINSLRMTNPSLLPIVLLLKIPVRCRSALPPVQTDMSARKRLHAAALFREAKLQKRAEIKAGVCWSLPGLMINARRRDAATPQLMNEACAQPRFLRHFYKRSEGRLRFGSCLPRVSFIN